MEKLIELQSVADTREDKQRVGHILEIVKKNPQLRLIRDQLSENVSVNPSFVEMDKGLSRRSATKKFSPVKSTGLKLFVSDMSNSLNRESFFNKNNSSAVRLASHLRDLKLSQKFQDSTEIEF